MIEEELYIATPSMFLPKPNSRAKPSHFAALLVDESEGVRGDIVGSNHQGRLPEQLRDNVRSKNRSSRKVTPELAAPSGFAFDVPSPDDIVFNARKGTSLAQRRGQ